MVVPKEEAVVVPKEEPGGKWCRRCFVLLTIRAKRGGYGDRWMPSQVKLRAVVKRQAEALESQKRRGDSAAENQEHVDRLWGHVQCLLCWRQPVGTMCWCGTMVFHDRAVEKWGTSHLWKKKAQQKQKQQGERWGRIWTKLGVSRSWTKL